MYAPGAATGWGPQPQLNETTPASNATHGSSSGTTSQASSGNWTDYSKQYAQYGQYWNQQSSLQPSTPQKSNPQVPSDLKKFDKLR